MVDYFIRTTNEESKDIDDIRASPPSALGEVVAQAVFSFERAGRPEPKYEVWKREGHGEPEPLTAAEHDEFQRSLTARLENLRDPEAT